MCDSKKTRAGRAAAGARSIRRILAALLSAAAIFATMSDSAPLNAADALATKSPAVPSPIQSYEVLKNFTRYPGQPEVRVLEIADGSGVSSFYGTDSEGYGRIFRISPNGDGGFTSTALHAFAGTDGSSPISELIAVGDGYLYGTTGSGGELGYGTIFRIFADGSGFETLHAFAAGTDGRNPGGPLLYLDGAFYGTTSGGSSASGTIFSVSTDFWELTTLHTFGSGEGWGPYGALIEIGGVLYGTTILGGTYDEGTIFRMAADGSDFGTVHDFTGGAGGSWPIGAVVQGTSGDLYGLTTNGGASSAGIAYKVATSGEGFTILHDFGAESDGQTPRGGLIQADDLQFYGTTSGGGASGNGTVFRISAGGSYAILHAFDGSDGAGPFAGLIQGADGNLYGTTFEGGDCGRGTVFELSLDGTTHLVLDSFRASALPVAALTRGSDGRLYGTSNSGDLQSHGTVFRVETDGSLFTVLHAFDGLDGESPQAPLVQGGDGNFYGAAVHGGGPSGCGVLFRISGDGTGFAILHAFDGTDGCHPVALVGGAAGSFYGVTAGGYTGADYGTVFKLYPDGESWSVQTLHSFAGSDGAYPYGLTLGSDGELYGTTAAGGAHGVENSGPGTVFGIGTDGNGFATLHSFDTFDGADPRSAPAEGAAGWFYGTTRGGGDSDAGTIYKISKDGTGFATLHSFNFTDGLFPAAGLVRDAAGRFYGTTDNGGGSNEGTVFELATNETDLTTLHSFGGGTTDGGGPIAGLLLSDGSLYGTTYAGGTISAGTIFRIELVSGTSPTVSASAGGPTTFCADSNVVLTATPSGGTGSYTGYQWYRDGTAIDGATSSTHTADASGSYTVTVTDSGANTSAPSEPVAVTVNALPQPEITAEGPTTLLCGGSVTLTASAASSWLWSTTETTQSITVSDAGDYTVIVTDENGCTGGSPATTVTVDAPVAIVSGGGAACPKSPRTIEAELGGTGPWNLTWSDGYVQNGVTSSPATRDVSPRRETTYSIASFSDANCAGTSEGSATVTPSEAPKAVLKGSTAICPGGEATLSVTLTGTAPWSITWSDGPTEDGIVVTPHVRTVAPAETTVYSLTAVSDESCSGTTRGSARIRVSRRCP